MAGFSEIMDILVIFFAVFAFVFGICVGSFSNVLIYRLPRNESINFPASHCPKCSHKLNFYHNIPLFSWLFLGGKCAFCKQKISLVYPLVELASGLLFLICFFKECGEALSIETLLYALFLGLCFIMLLALSVIDIRYKAVPDALLFAALFFAFAYALLLFIFKGNFAQILNLILFGFIFWALRFVVSYAMKKEAMGSADIFIAAIIGAILPAKLALVAIYLAALLTLPVYALVRKNGYELAFVPFLSLGLLVTYAFDGQILEILRFIYE